MLPTLHTAKCMDIHLSVIHHFDFHLHVHVFVVLALFVGFWVSFVTIHEETDPFDCKTVGFLRLAFHGLRAAFVP